MDIKLENLTDAQIMIESLVEENKRLRREVVDLAEQLTAVNDHYHDLIEENAHIEDLLEAETDRRCATERELFRLEQDSKKG